MQKKKFFKGAISMILSALIALSSFSVFAASTGSITDDLTAGEDRTQGVKTEYSIVSPDTVQSQGADVYLTVDASNILVFAPKKVIVSGTIDPTDKLYKGYYTVKVEGDFPGDKVISVVPDETVTLNQPGKESILADISQDKTTFTAEDVLYANPQDENPTNIGRGLVSTAELTAGSWNGVFNFTIGMDDNSQPSHSISDIVTTVFGENGTVDGYMNWKYGSDNTNSNYDFSLMRTYNIYLLPVSSLGLSVGDKIIMKNINTDNYIFTLFHLNSSLRSAGNSIAVNPNSSDATYTITSNDAYFGIQVINQSTSDTSSRIYFDKANIPIQDFLMYKNSVSDENIIDYISVWDKMITLDEEFDAVDFNLHNADADQKADLLAEIPYFQLLDVDLRKTADGYWVNCHNSTLNGLTISKSTLSQLYSVSDNVIPWNDICEYAAKNNVRLRISDNTVRDDNGNLSGSARYSQSNIDEIFNVAKMYGAESLVSLGSDFWPCFNNLTDIYFPCELWTQTRSNYDLSTYLTYKSKVPMLYLSTIITTTTSAFSVAQIKELVDNGIYVGVGSIDSSSQSFSYYVSVCNIYSEVLDDFLYVGCENNIDVAYFKAAYRNAKGLV